MFLIYYVHILFTFVVKGHKIMYCLEVYTNNFNHLNKEGIKSIPNLSSFDYIMKGMIKNAAFFLHFKPVDKHFSKVVCNLQDYIRFQLTRSEKSYTIKILLPDHNLRFLEE